MESDWLFRTGNKLGSCSFNSSDDTTNNNSIKKTFHGLIRTHLYLSKYIFSTGRRLLEVLLILIVTVTIQVDEIRNTFT